ncbi:MAG TPA: hypothetical protein VMN37_07280 [Gemmatimonadales bacterium]|nr:hypothetical protein [Gemmatimonadales bacterium]
MTRLGTFALLYMTAVLLELVERWRHPSATLAALALVVVMLRVGITRATFLGFLGLSTAYFLLAGFPDVANHVNIIIYCNILLMAGIGYSLARRRDFPADDDAYEMLRPVLQASLILVYVLAGFAKLNRDFLDPGVSCVGNMVADLVRLRNSSVAGVPTLLLVLASLVIAADLLLASSGRQQLRWWVRGGGLAVGLAGLLLAPRLPPGGPAPAAGSVLLAMAALVILWELVGGALLAVPRLQAPVLAFSWTMHASLALIGFVDFGGLALALLFTFVPGPWLELLGRPVRAPFLARPVHRAYLYFAICVVAGVFSGLGRRTPAGLFFNLAALVLIWPLLAAALGGARPAWPGVPLSSGATPRWMLAFPVLLLLFGLTSYLGLRTAGNFTMFSNLRTEGERSNHLLLGGNPLKRWGYQEDLVRFTHIDDGRAEIGYNYQPLEGHLLPVVEFRKLIRQWTRAGRTVPMTFEYRGQVHTTGDIAQDPAWRTPRRDWEMRLMDFRVVQGEGANRCRW